MTLDSIGHQVNLQNDSWWKVGGVAEHYAAPNCIEDLTENLKWAKAEGHEVHLLSGGSNVLVKDGLIHGLTLHLKNLNSIEEIQEDGDWIRVTCLAGTPKSELAKVFLQRKLAPAVFLTGIPGDIGGGVVMNAGVGEQRVPREFCEIVEWVEILRVSANGESRVHRVDAKDLKWEYRSCTGWEPGVIVRVGIKWANQPSAEVMNEVRAATKKRVSTQPLNIPSCGSVFRNPPGLKSAKLIESCGLKGFRIGGASVSTKHANFIVNDQQAKAEDIRQLILHIQKCVKEEHGVDLHPEVKFFGGWNLNPA